MVGEAGSEMEAAAWAGLSMLESLTLALAEQGAVDRDRLLDLLTDACRDQAALADRGRNPEVRRLTVLHLKKVIEGIEAT